MKDPGKDAEEGQSNVEVDDPGVKNQRIILFVAAGISMIVATAAGYYLWDAIVVGLLAILAWSKQLLTVKGLLLLLKKFGILLILGSKKLLFTIIGKFMMVAAHAKLPWARKLIVRLKWWARGTKRSLRSRWGSMNALDKTLAITGSIPLVLSILLVTLVYLLPKSIVSYLISRVQMSSGATILNKSLPSSAQEKLQRTHQKATKLIRTTLTSHKNDDETQKKENKSE